MLRILPLLLLFYNNALFAHTVKPAYLNIQNIKNYNYNITWKIPINKDETTLLSPQFPNDCQKSSQNNYSLNDKNIIIHHWLLSCSESLRGKEMSIKGMEDGITDVLVRFEDQDKNSYIERLTPTKNRFTIKAETSGIGTIKTYTFLGVKHILLGFDHLLFILALMFIIPKWQILVKPITAFTLAHSITLGLSILGYVHLPSSFIEVLIALSIIILAVEGIHLHHGKKGLSIHYPWLVVFIFGLLHGFGFATVLTELGLPENSILLALSFFNLGIEVGQLLFIFTLLLFYALVKKIIPNSRLIQGRIVLLYILGTTASYWFIERIYLMINQQPY